MAEIFEISSLLQISSFIIAILASGIITFILIPKIMEKMKIRGITGRDWNKKEEVHIPELGGIAFLIGFPMGLSLASGVLQLFGDFNSTPILAAIGVAYISGMIGLIDDISHISSKMKGLVAAFAALPLLMVHYGDLVIDFPFGFTIDLTDYFLIFWFVLAPLAVTGVANAMNMSAGYNGLETGQVAIVSLFLLIATMLSSDDIFAMMIFASIFGCSIALNAFNSYPAAIFVGNVGTYSMGGAIAAGVIIGGVELAGIIAIAPVFFELFATVYYSFIKKVDSETRKQAHRRPIIDEEGKLHPHKGSEKYKLSIYLLSRKPSTEPQLVRRMLFLFVISGLIAVIVTLL